jgi:histidinol-phosphatase
MGDVEDDLQLARRAALAGSEVAMRYFAAVAGLRRERKLDGSVVTEADRAVEATVRAVLTGARPSDAVLGEEGGETAGTGRRRWIIDPIDGTALFVAGDDRWLVLLALEVDARIEVGVAVVPVQRRIWWARHRHGAWEATIGGEPHRITAAAGGPSRATGATGPIRPDGSAAGGPTRPDDPEAAGADGLVGWRFAVLPSYDDAAGANVVPKAPEVVAPLLPFTPALPWDLHPPLLVARGDLDLAVQTSGMVWDFAATSLIVAEAGGVYRSFAGGRQPQAGPSLFAATERIAAAALRRLLGGDEAEQRAQ